MWSHTGSWRQGVFGTLSELCTHVRPTCLSLVTPSRSQASSRLSSKLPATAPEAALRANSMRRSCGGVCSTCRDPKAKCSQQLCRAGGTVSSKRNVAGAGNLAGAGHKASADLALLSIQTRAERVARRQPT